MTIEFELTSWEATQIATRRRHAVSTCRDIARELTRLADNVEAADPLNAVASTAALNNAASSLVFAQGWLTEADTIGVTAMRRQVGM